LWEKKEPTVVEVAHTDGTEVIRSRSTSDNRYVLNGAPLVAFGDEVPDEVKVEVNVTDINVQGQGDRPFLLDMPAPEVARYLNNIANLAIIDTAHTRIAGKMRTCDAEVNAVTLKRDESTSLLIKFGDLDSVRARLAAAAGVEAHLAQQKRELAALRALVTQYEKIAADCTVFAFLDRVAEDGKDLTDRANELAQSSRAFDRLRRLENDGDVVDLKLSHLEGVSKWTDAAQEELTQQGFRLERHTLLRNSMREMMERVSRLNLMCSSFAGIDNLDPVSARDAVLELVKKENSFGTFRSLVVACQRLMGEEKNTSVVLEDCIKTRDALLPAICPLCGAPTCKQSH